MLFNRFSRAVLGSRRMSSATRADQTRWNHMVSASRQTTSLRATINQTLRIASDRVAEPEHLFCGVLTQETSLAAVAARSFGFEYESSVDQLVGPAGSREAGLGVKSPNNSEVWSERSQLVFSLALREALRDCCPKVDTEHLLLGIVAESMESNTCLSRLLLEHGADYHSVKQTIQRLRSALGSLD